MKSQEIGLASFGTLVLWVGCLVVSVAGMVWPHRLPSSPRDEPTAVTATLLNVSIADAPASPTDSQSSASKTPDDPLPTPSMSTPSDAPPLQSVAEPSAKIAFALPTKSAGPVVPAAQAAPIHSSPQAVNNAPTGPTVAHLIYGQGDGQQPAPEYPREAVLAGQQGTVVVRFTVGADGRVQSAIAQVPCESAILNNAAVRAVRNSWRFKSGPVRVFDVSIVYQLNEK